MSIRCQWRQMYLRGILSRSKAVAMAIPCYADKTSATGIDSQLEGHALNQNSFFDFNTGSLVRVLWSAVI